MLHQSLWSRAGAVAFITFSLIGCSQQNATKGAQKGGGGGRGGGARQAVNVKTATIQHISVQRSIDLSGTLASPDQTHVSSEVAGIVREVLVEIGQEVALGQDLVRLDTTELKLAVDRAESALRQTEAQLGIDSSKGGQPPADEQIAAVRTAAANRDDARNQLSRAQELFGKGLSSKADFDTAQTRVKVADAAYQAALDNVQALKASLQDRRAAHDLAKKKMADAVIKAPVAGAIFERPVQRGEYIREQTPVVTIVRMDPLKLKTAVQEKYANLIRQNQTVDFSVEPFPNETFHGKIAYISPAVDQASRTFQAEVLVSNPGHKLKPGFFAKGDILTGRDDNVLAVPEDTVSTLAGVSSVYVIENGTVKQVTVQLGEREGKNVEVVSGLKGHEILAASNLNELVSGVKIGAGGDDEEGGIAGGAPGGGGQRRGGKGRGGNGGKREGGGGDKKGDAQ